VITGWTTALQQMHAGDRWMLYIPSDLGYGTSGSTSIPSGSTLIFDLYLEKVVALEPSGKGVE
jgi:FKBP-type peptidyl-prolyl cis-trans isomerase FklB